MKEKIYELADEIKLIQGKIESINNDNNYEEKLSEYTRCLFVLKATLQKMEKEAYLKMEPNIVGEEVDLYLKNIHEERENDPDQFKYIITLHDTKTVVGSIDIRFHLLESEKYLGNIGANIDSMYRGKRYSKMAIELLHDTMIEHGLTKPIFTVNEDNNSSLHSLEAIGAKKTGEGVNEGTRFYIYEYDIENIKHK